MAANTAVKVVLSADPVGVIRGFAQADTAGKKFAESLGAISNIGKAALGQLGQSIAKVDAQMQKIATKAKWTGIGMGVSLAGAAWGAIKLEAAMKNVATIDTSLQGGIGKAQNQIIELSRILPRSAQDIAEGYYDIASSGFTGARGIMVLTAAVKAGSAGLATTAEAGKAITAVLNAYGLSANKAGQVSDELFSTVNFGVVTFSELTGVIGDTVGLAAQMGVPFKDVGAALATMTLTGISAAESGTALNRVLQSFVQPSEALSKAWAQISPNMSILDSIKDKSIGLFGVMEKLRVASQGNIEVLMEWFNEIRAGKGALALMSAGGETYARIQREMNKSAGATAAAFKQQMDSAQASIQLFANQMKSIGLEVGISFLEPIKKTTNALTYFAGAWNVIPRPIKTMISYGYALSAIMLVVSGLFGIWLAKGLLATKMYALLGTAIQGAGAKMAGMTVAESALSRSTIVQSLIAKWNALGTAIVASGNKVAGSGLAFLNPFRAINSMANGVIGVVIRLGTAVGHLPGVFGAAGAKIVSFGESLRTIKSMIPLVIAGFAALGVAALVMLAGMNAGKNAADDWYKATVIKNADLDTYEGINRALERNRQAYLDARDGAITYFRGVQGFLRGWAGTVGHGALSLVGLGEMVKSPTDAIFKMDRAYKGLNSLQEANSAIAGMNNRIYLELASTMGSTAASTLMLGDSMGDSAKEQDMMATNLSLTARAIKKVGLEFNDPSTFTPKQVKAVTQAFVELKSQIGGASVQGNKYTKEAEKAMDDLLKYFKDIQTQTAENWNKAFDIAGAVKSGGAAGRSELQEYLKTTSAEAEAFVNNIDELMRRGLNPDTLLQLAVAGPEAAGKAVEAIASSTGTTMIDMVNETAAKMRELRIRLQMENDLIGKAALNPQWASELGTALDIQSKIMEARARSTPEQIASMLNLDVATVVAVAGHYGIIFSENLTAAFRQKMAQDQSPIGQAFASAVQASIDQTSNLVGLSSIERIWTTFKDSGHAAALAVIADMDLIPEDRQILIDLVNKQELDRVFAKLQRDVGYLTDEQWQVVVEAVTAGADLNVEDLKAKLTALGLTPAEIEVIVDAVTAKGDLDDTKKKSDEVDGKKPKVKVDSSEAQTAKERLNAIESKMTTLSARPPVTLKVNIVETTTKKTEVQKADGSVSSQWSWWGLNGGILNFFAGGKENHQAEIARAGDWRVWAEPETGGEAYIPLAASKRSRSTKLLEQVAKRFGYKLEKYAAGDVIGDIQKRQAAIDALAPSIWQTQVGRNEMYIIDISTPVDENGNWTRDQAAIDKRMTEIAEILVDVRDAAGEGAMNELMNANLWGQNFEEAARKIIQDAEQAKRDKEAADEEAKRSAADAAAEAKRTAEDAARDAAQRAEEAAREQQQAADEAARAAKEEADRIKQLGQSMFDSIYNGIWRLSDAASVFGKDSGASAEGIMDYFDQMKRGATEFKSVMDQLRAAGLNDTAMKDIFAQGVDGLNYARAILEGGAGTVDFINTTMKDIQSIAVATGTDYAKQYEPSYQGPYDYKAVVTTGATTPTPAGTGGGTVTNINTDISITIPTTGAVNPDDLASKVQILLEDSFREIADKITIKVGQ